ncbi:MAG TPA: hypothetical protein VE077_13775 [Candidatus Methylomirabilis sp.]|nr:hypothetical protein [Candidatus Methylomirabilis sp.]
MKQKREIIALVVLLIIAALVWGYHWTVQAPVMGSLDTIRQYKILAEQDSRIHWDALERAQKTEYKSNGRNPFSAAAPPPRRDPNKPKPAPIPVPQPLVQATTAVLPPNLKYFGYGTVPSGSPRRAFFTDGEDVYIVPEGDTLLGRYRILRVGNANLEFQEISSGLHGTAPLEEQAAPPNA